MFKLHKQEYKNKTKKYVIINKFKGGGAKKPHWYDDFFNEVDSIYDSKYIITGSSAIALYLVYFNSLTNYQFNEFIPNLRIPNDVNFVYYCKSGDYETSNKIGNYDRLQSSPQRSVTYIFNSSETIPNFIKSFDLTCLPKINYIQIEKYKVLTLEELLQYYSRELKDHELCLGNYETNYKDLEARIEKSKKKNNLTQQLNLEEEQSLLIANLEKNKNKILTITLKINIVNVLIKHIKTDAVISTKYIVESIPTLSSPRHTVKKDDTIISNSESEPESNTLSLYKRLFGSQSTSNKKSEDNTLNSVDSKGKQTEDLTVHEEKVEHETETPIASRKLKFDSETPQLNLSLDSKKVTSMPPVTQKLDFSLETPKTKTVTSSDIIVKYEPYEIKFNFED